MCMCTCIYRFEPLVQGLPQGCHQGVSRDWCYLQADGGRFSSNQHSHGFWQGLGTHYLLAKDISFLPYGALHQTTCNMAACFFQSEGTGREREEERTHKTEVTFSYNLILETTLKHFCGSLLIRIMTVSADHSQEEGIT